MTELKIEMRPVLPRLAKRDEISIEELFQNQVLRPIIKLQHHLILVCFENHLKRTKSGFLNYNRDQKAEFITKSFHRNQQLKTEMRGLIVGLFTLKEYKEYLESASFLNKRINSIIEKRVSDTLIERI